MAWEGAHGPLITPESAREDPESSKTKTCNPLGLSSFCPLSARGGREKKRQTRERGKARKEEEEGGKRRRRKKKQQRQLQPGLSLYLSRFLSVFSIATFGFIASFHFLLHLILLNLTFMHLPLAMEIHKITEKKRKQIRNSSQAFKKWAITCPYLSELQNLELIGLTTYQTTSFLVNTTLFGT